MIKRIQLIVVIIFLVGLVYLMMMLFQPTVNAMVETANSTVNWSAHADFPKAQSLMVGWPFWSYLVPGVVGMAGVVAVLRGE